MQLCSGLYGSLDGEGSWGRMDTCVCVAESITAYVWLYPNSKQKVILKEIKCNQKIKLKLNILN